MTTTIENLQTAFAGESQANRKYLAFARKAEKEGYPQIARLFRAAAEAETIHALAHFTNMGKVGSTLENIEDAIAGETYEYTEMYPPMTEQARADGHRSKTMLAWAQRVEEVHAKLFTLARQALEQGKDLEVEVYLCPVCGHLELGKPGEKCPVCGSPAERYERVS